MAPRFGENSDVTLSLLLPEWQGSGTDPMLAWQRVSHHVMAEQANQVAIPKRFGIVMQEIWTLQPRFEQRLKKRVFRLLAHPRFRAAYDFLLLRAAESPEIAELGEWWTRAQATPHDVLAQDLSAAPPVGVPAPVASQPPAVEGVPATAAKRRRRRRRKPSGAASQPAGE